VKAPSEAQSAAISTAGELARLIEKRDGAQARDDQAAAALDGEDADIPVPGPVAAAGRAAIGFFQKALYGGVFDLEVTGQAGVPSSGAFLVAANHSSHLDVGLVKIALGEEGKKLASLAARDYFFDNPWKRAWFGNFTNLVPIQRRGSLKESLHTAVRTLEYGYHLLIFPEGTRSPDGSLQEFKPAIAYSRSRRRGHLARLPGRNTRGDAQGAFLPDPRKRRKLIVRIGPVLRHEDCGPLRRGSRDRPRTRR